MQQEEVVQAQLQVLVHLEEVLMHVITMEVVITRQDKLTHLQVVAVVVVVQVVDKKLVMVAQVQSS